MFLIQPKVLDSRRRFYNLSTVKGVSVYEPRIVLNNVFVATRENLKFVIINFHESQQHTVYKRRHLNF